MPHSAEEPNLEQYQIVKDLIDRQDIVLQDIDDLNSRIETFIKEISQARQEEMDREAAVEGAPAAIAELKKAA